MKTQVRCNTCKFGDWGYKGKKPCDNDGCIGFHKWQPKTELPKMITVQCRSCGERSISPVKCPYTGYEYSAGWVMKCTVCNNSMTEVKDD